MSCVQTPLASAGTVRLARLRQSSHLRHRSRSFRYHTRALVDGEASPEETQRSHSTRVAREPKVEKGDHSQFTSTNTDRSRDTRGLLWGSSARRGVVDKRKKLSTNEKSASGSIEATKANNIDYGSIADGVERWYLLQVQPLRETAAQRVINSLNKKRLSSTGEFAKIETIVPVAYEEGINPRTQRLTQMKRMLLPGYVMAKCVMSNDLYQLLFDCQAVKGFVGMQYVYGPFASEKIQLPQPMPEPQLEQIFTLMGEEESAMEERVAAKPEFPFEEGDLVQVMRGPYKGFSGQVMGLDVEAREVNVMLVIFSKPTEVNLPPEDLQKAAAKTVKLPAL